MKIYLRVRINFLIWAPTLLVNKYKFLVARGQIIFAKNSPWWLGNVQLVLIVAVVEVYLQEDSFHF